MGKTRRRVPGDARLLSVVIWSSLSTAINPVIGMLLRWESRREGMGASITNHKLIFPPLKKKGGAWGIPAIKKLFWPLQPKR